MNLGPAEIIVILVVALLVFGPNRMPQVGRQVGAAMREFRKVQTSVRSEIDAVLKVDDPAPSPPRPPLTLAGGTAVGTAGELASNDAESESESEAAAPAGAGAGPGAEEADHDELPPPPPPEDAEPGFRGPDGSFL